jgi:hypothetical protein
MGLIIGLTACSAPDSKGGSFKPIITGQTVLLRATGDDVDGSLTPPKPARAIQSKCRSKTDC